jgi:AraC family transcriptional regulator of adaptative response/methylated-DNA-[protein]-cysteine methyltransferase
MTGITPKAYAAAHRDGRIRQQLQRTKTVTRAVYDAGFNSSARFYASASDRLGMAPSQFRRGAPNTRIRFAIGECSLGAVLVAATDKGVCSIMLGDEPGILLRNLEDRFAKAEFVGPDRAFGHWVAKVVAFVESPTLGLDLPLDIRGTVFQQRVWQALRKIPFGSTASYSDIARQIGSPKAVRAVARACGANPVALAVPCHRVIRTDGALCGYRWGVERKRVLLDRESGSLQPEKPETRNQKPETRNQKSE